MMEVDRIGRARHAYWQFIKVLGRLEIIGVHMYSSLHMISAVEPFLDRAIASSDLLS